jgi:hypothetical protein
MKKQKMVAKEKNRKETKRKPWKSRKW